MGVPIIAGSLFFEELRSDIDRPKANRSSNRLLDWSLSIGEENVFLIGTEEVLTSPKGSELDLELLDSSFFTRAVARVMTWLIAGVADSSVCSTRSLDCHRFPGGVVPRSIRARSPIRGSLGPPYLSVDSSWGVTAACRSDGRRPRDPSVLDPHRRLRIQCRSKEVRVRRTISPKPTTLHLGTDPVVETGDELLAQLVRRAGIHTLSVC